MVSGLKGHGEIKLGVFTGLPFGGTDSSYLFTIDEDDTSTTEIGWSVELVGSLVISDWEDNSVIVTEVSFDF